MVGPSVTEADRKEFLKRAKIGFSLLVGGSMGLVALWGGAGLALVVGIGVGAAVIGRVMAEYVLPDSIAEVPYDEGKDRGPKPGARTQQRREKAEERQTRAANGDGRSSRRESE